VTAFLDKRILVLAPDLPYPCIGGGRRRMASILDALGSLATVRIAARAASIPTETATWCEHHGCSIDGIDTQSNRLLRRIIIRLRGIISGDWQAWDRRERVLCERIFDEFRPDLVWVEAPYQIRYALSWRDRVPIVMDFWGTSEGAERILSHTQGIAKVWHRYHCYMARRNEARQVPRMTAAVVVSAHCASRLRSLTERNTIHVVPTALEDRGGVTVTPRARDPNVIILSGVMSFEPNVDASCWFVKEIFPRIRRMKPAARVILAGSSPAAEIRALAAPDAVDIAGEVRDLPEFIACAAMYALPMRLGSGIRTKLLDVFPTGTPIVTTSIGAEGFDLRHQESALFADDAESFAQACIRLLDDPMLANRIGAEAKRLAAEAYTQEQVRRSCALVLECCFADSTARRNNSSS
jgi:glycosyltransferase involved in cell wall biosynthesis